MALYNLGLAHIGAGNPIHTIEVLQRACAIVRDIGDQRHEMMVLELLLNTYVSQGESRCAAQISEQIQTLARSQQGPGAV
jgi:hypothetical protein